MKENSLVPSNEIWYTTVDGKPIEFRDSIWTLPISNTYKEGKGVVVFQKHVVEIGLSSSDDCTNLCEIIIPEGVISIGQGAFYGCTYLKAPPLISVTLDGITISFK